MDATGSIPRPPLGATKEVDKRASLVKTAQGRGCVKTSLRMGDKKIDLTESRMRDDHRPAKGLRYPIFDAAIMFLEFLHNLGRLRNFVNFRGRCDLMASCARR